MVSPFCKQCFVTAGGAINVAQSSLVFGLSASLIPQLQKTPNIELDDNVASWIVSIPGLTMLIGAGFLSVMMEKLGRKKTHIISSVLILIGWIIVVSSNSILVLFLGRCLQGLAMGISNTLVPIIIGECSSPVNRGYFGLVPVLNMSILMALVHTLGAYLHWRITGIVCTAITAVSLVIVALSPETPSWLASKGRYEECRRVFRWLRGDGEEDELDKMIAASRQRALEETTSSLRTRVRTLISTSRDQAFYKPIIIVLHIYTFGQLGGTNVLSSYIMTMMDELLSEDADKAAVIISIGVVRLTFSFISIYLMRRFKRRTFLYAVGMNGAVWFTMGCYVYAKQRSMLPYDHPAIGALLMNLLIISVAAGTNPLTLVIPSEIFPLRYRSYACSLTSMVRTLIIFLVSVSYPFLVNIIEMAGTFWLYAGVLGHCLVVTWYMLPETKDRTLQDIETEFEDKSNCDGDVQATAPLKPKKLETDV